MEPSSAILKLPAGVVSIADVRRLSRELSSLDDFFIAAKGRRAGTPVQLPAVSRLLSQLATDNQINLLDAAGRKNLAAYLELLAQRAPQLHISFTADPPQQVTEKILAWLRQNVNAETLLTIGIQPSIAAGCMLRTPNKIFDMSLRQHLENQESYLQKMIQGVANGQQ